MEDFEDMNFDINRNDFNLSNESSLKLSQNDNSDVLAGIPSQVEVVKQVKSSLKQVGPQSMQMII